MMNTSAGLAAREKAPSESVSAPLPLPFTRMVALDRGLAAFGNDLSAQGRYLGAYMLAQHEKKHAHKQLVFSFHDVLCFMMNE
jgi:hypothetical protein